METEVYISSIASSFPLWVCGGWEPQIRHVGWLNVETRGMSWAFELSWPIEYLEFIFTWVRMHRDNRRAVPAFLSLYPGPKTSS